MHSIVSAFWQSVRQYPTEIALVDPSVDGLCEYQWQQLGRLVAHAADTLGDCTKHGAHVASWLPNSLAWIVLDLAAQTSGRVHVPLDRRIPLIGVWELSQHAQAEVLVVPHEDLSAFQQSPPTGTQTHVVDAARLVAEQAADVPTEEHTLVNSGGEVAQILYTSGTMSQPKGVMLTHANLYGNARAKLDAAPQDSEDVRLNILPFAHAYARTCELSTWILSRSRLCLSRDWKHWLYLAPRIQPTLVNLVPHLATKLVASLRDAERLGHQHTSVLGDKLRLLQVGGAALRVDDWNYLATAGWPPLQGYGLTEASPVVCSNRTGSQRAQTVGPTVPGVEVKLDEQGILWTRGPHVMAGYWDAPHETSRKIVDGWLCTGDLAEPTTEGHWRILGRADDQITLSTGYKADPHELVERLSADPWVEHLVIVGQDRPFLSALVWPKWEQVPTELQPTNLREAEQSQTGLMANSQAFALTRSFLERWQARCTDLPRQLHIQRVALLASPLTVARGELNFKGAVRRKIIEQQLRNTEIEQLYAAE